mmetsp:Transcript_6450/g.16394  ORF Transcript_6450/g.16394 Transcript_6450/m.16394 type:complete len:240 (-) Transcript_6450:619-1338(-)
MARETGPPLAWHARVLLAAPWLLTFSFSSSASKKTVGSVVRLEEQLDPIAVVSAINLQKHKDKAFVRDIRGVLASRAPASLKAQVSGAFGEDGCALIVSERVVNSPLELSSPLQQAIFDEIAWATEDEPTEALRKSFMFSRFLLFSRIYIDKAPPAGKKQKQMPQRDGIGARDQVVYVRPEDEFLHKHCQWSFTYPTQTAHDIQGLHQYRLVMGIDHEGVARARKGLDAIFGKFLPEKN